MIYVICILGAHLLIRVIDGWEVLDVLEELPVDKKHRPLEPVRIQSVTIHANPIADQQQ